MTENIIVQPLQLSELSMSVNWVWNEIANSDRFNSSRYLDVYAPRFGLAPLLSRLIKAKFHCLSRIG